MKAALAVPKQSLAWTPEETLVAVDTLVAAAADRESDLVLFPELAATPGEITDDPQHDLLLAEPIPGEVSDRLASMARAHEIYFGIGILERDGEHLYDCALLFGPTGEIALKYRRINPQWHGRHADPHVYRQGDEMPVASTGLGRLCFAVCGDLFDDAVVERIKSNCPDYVLWPVARNFSDGSFRQERWDREEECEYTAAAASTGAATLMVNRLVDPASSAYPSFGGALVISKLGEAIARLPLAKSSILFFDLSDAVQ